MAAKRGIAGGIAVLGLAVLSGCGGSNVSGDWRCPMPSGSSCAPTSEVDPYAPGARSQGDGTHSAVTDPKPAPVDPKPALAAPGPEASATTGGNQSPTVFEKIGGFLAAVWQGRPEAKAGSGDAAAAGSGKVAGGAGAVPAGPVKVERQALPAPGGPTKLVVAMPAPSASVVVAPVAAKVVRRPEETARIWIAPYQDAAGYLHEGEYVHIVVRPGRWEKL